MPELFWQFGADGTVQTGTIMVKGKAWTADTPEKYTVDALTLKLTGPADTPETVPGGKDINAYVTFPKAEPAKGDVLSLINEKGNKETLTIAKVEAAKPLSNPPKKDSFEMALLGGDKNGDGKLSRGEASTFPAWKTGFDRFDTNEDGFVDEAEFEVVKASKPNTGPTTNPTDPAPSPANPEPKTEPANPEPNVPTKKLTAAEATEVMAWDIGKWETKGQGMPAGGQPQVIEITMEARWKVEGKSVEYKFTMVQDGKTVSYFGYKEYDVTKGIFIYRSKWGENPETTSHERYDPATRTTHAQTIPPAKTMSTTIIKRVGKDKTQQKLRVFEDGYLVYSQDVVSIRKGGHQSTNPESKTEPPKP